MTRSSLLILLVSLARAQDVTFIKLPVSQDTELPFWQQNLTTFESSLKTYVNATAQWPILAPDLAKSPDELNSTSIGNWTWEISVSDHLPFFDDPLQPKDDGQGPFFYTGGEIKLNSMTSSDANSPMTVDDDWEMCLVYWDLGLLSLPYPDAMRSDNGTCTSVLTSDCISDMVKAAKPKEDKTCSCPQLSDIPSCQQLDPNATAVFTNDSCVAEHYSADDLSKQTNIIARLTLSGAAAHPGNETDYNDVGTKAWPLILTFNSDDDDADLGSMTCLRAADAVKGSTAPSPPAAGTPPAETPPSTGSHVTGLNWGLMTGTLILSLACLS